jgi:WD40 repeat protein/serine/threonine protein kinase
MGWLDRLFGRFKSADAAAASGSELPIELDEVEAPDTSPSDDDVQPTSTSARVTRLPPVDGASAADGASVVRADGASGGVAVALASQLDPDPLSAAGAGLPVGEVVADTYRVKRLLASGERFAVYLVDHIPWDTPVIIKMPRPEILAETGAARAIAQDAARWSELGLHPHIAYCFYAHTINQTPLVVLEYLEGGCLRPWISSGRTANLQIGINLAIQMCHGLEWAHDQGVWHGTFSPENVLLTGEGVARITDFWNESRALLSGRANSASGQPTKRSERTLDAYVAPEQWVDSDDVDAQSDIFALGVCLYEIFCGRRPYEIARGPRRQGPEPRSAHNDARLPDALATVLKRCVEWDPDRRPTSVAEIGAALCDLHQELFDKPSPFAHLPHESCGAAGWNNQAIAAILQGRTADAQAAWERALGIDAGHVESIYNLWVHRWRHSEVTDEAVVRQLEHIVATNSYDWRAPYLLALVHLERGDATAALPLLERTLAIAPPSAEVETAVATTRTRTEAAPNRARVSTVHRAFVSDLALSEDGRWVVSSGDDSTIRIVDTATGRALRTLEGHARRVSSVSMNADSTVILSGGDDSTLRLWDIKSARCTKILPMQGSVWAVALSADGTHALTAACASDKIIDDIWLQYWDLTKDRCLGKLTGHNRAAKVIALSGDGRRAISGSDDHTVRIWDLNSLTGRLLVPSHDHHVSAVAMSVDGHLAVSGSWDRTVRLWDTSTGRCLQTFLGHEGIVTSVCLSADGRLVVSGGWDNTVRVWDADSGRCLSTLAGHTSMVTAVRVSGDRGLAVSASWDKTIRFWSLPPPDTTVRPLRLSTRAAYRAAPSIQLQPSELLDEADAAVKERRWGDALVRVRQVQQRNDSRTEGRTTRLWRQLSRVCQRVELRSAAAVASMNTPEPIVAARLNSDARWVITAGRSEALHVWDLDLERCSRTLVGHTDRVWDVCLSTDDLTALSAGADRTLRLWDLGNGKCIRVLNGHQSIVSSVALSDDQESAVSGSYDHTVRVWDLVSGDCVRALIGHTRQVTAVCLSTDGHRAVSASFDHTARVWDVDTGAALYVLSGHTHAVLAVAFSAGGALVLTGARDNTARLWEAGSGRCVHVFEGHAAPVSAVLLTPDERWAFTASHDRTVRVWNVRTGACAHVLADATDALTALALSRDGGSLLAATDRPALQTWDVFWNLDAPE